MGLSSPGRWVAAGIALLLMAVSPSGGRAQVTIDARSQFDFAQSRFEAGAFDEAVVEFNRFIHFFPDDPDVPLARHRAAMAHFQAGRFDDAARGFGAIVAHYAGSPLDDEAFLMLSRTHARQGRTDQAVVDLFNLLALAPRPETTERAHYELGWLQVEQGRWNDAEEAFQRIPPDHRQAYGIEALLDDLARRDAVARKDPLTAGLLSVVPGGGQLYCGRYRDALTALLVNAGLIWAAWEAFDHDLNALGTVIGFVELGFYTGNIYGAVSSAHKFNRDRMDAFRQELRTRHRKVSLSLVPVSDGAALRLSVAF